MPRIIHSDDSTLLEVCYCASHAAKALMAGNAGLADEYKWGLVCHATHFDVDAEHYDRIRWHKEGHKYCQIIWFLTKYGGARFNRGNLIHVLMWFICWINRELERDTSHDDEVESYTLAELDSVVKDDDIDRIPFLRGQLHV